MRAIYLKCFTILFLLLTASIHADAAPEPLKIEGRLSIDANNLSGIVVTPTFLALATDEGTKIQVLPKRNGRFIAEAKGVINLTPGAKDELDLEGLAWQSPYLYAIGSHSSKRKKRHPDFSNKKNLKRLTPIYDEPARNQLFRIQLDDNLRPVKIDSLSLLPTIESSQILSPFLKIPSKENGIDIEGIAVQNNHLYIGFRGPVLRGNLTPIFKLTMDSHTFKIQKHKLKWVNLNGLGIRDMVADKQHFYLLAGPVNQTPNQFEIYYWDGKNHLDPMTPDLILPSPSPSAKPEAISLQKLPGWVLIAQDGAFNGNIKSFKIK